MLVGSDMVDTQQGSRQAASARGELLPGEEEPDEIPTPVGWTPPQWLPGLWLDGWREGTPVATRASASDSQSGMPDWL